MDDENLRIAETLIALRREVRELQFSVSLLKQLVAQQIAPEDPEFFLAQLAALEEKAFSADRAELKADLAMLRALKNWTPKPHS